MMRRIALALVMAATLAACQAVGPVHIGEINQARATALAQTELQRRHLDAYGAWRSEVSDYGMLWEVKADGAGMGYSSIKPTSVCSGSDVDHALRASVVLMDMTILGG